MEQKTTCELGIKVMDDYKQIDRNRPAPVLTRKNWETWFKLMTNHFKAKQVHYVLAQTKEQYAWIKPHHGTAEKPSTTPSTSTPSADDPMARLTEEFAKFGGTWNIEKKATYEADEAAIIYKLLVCLGELDNEDMEAYETAKAKWDALWEKYSKTRPTTDRENLRKLYTFEIEPDTTIQEAWTRIKELRRKAVTSEPSLKTTLSEERMLQLLLAALPKEYHMTRDALDASNQSVEEALNILETKEERLKEEQAMIAGQTRNRYQRRRSSSVSSQDSMNDKRTCYQCKSFGHLSPECPYKDRITEMIRQITR